MKALDPDYLGPRQFFKMPKGLDDYTDVLVLNFIFTWVIPIACIHACTCACIVSEIKTRLNSAGGGKFVITKITSSLTSAAEFEL